MSETNNSLRIRTNINSDSYVSVKLDQTYDSFEILSMKMRSEDVYKTHNSNYGVIAGRVLANENFGVPNAKISIFIEGDFADHEEEINILYPYSTTSNKNVDGIPYNLLPNEKVDDCHQVVGTFPNKTYLLDNDVLISVFNDYYVYTTRTNNSGDYIIAGVPTGNQTLHMDLDLSDCGILSQKPRDFVYKGYTIEQFENPNKFKTSKDLNNLSQIFRQDQVVNVIPFWGNADGGETIGITRADINVAFKFEPTCVFIGSLVADNASNGISKKCVPTPQMGSMDELTTGKGTIEMIRKTPAGGVEEFQIKGTELIDGNGIWCYQIPMNLDYMMTDEYGDMVPTDDPSKGIPTRARVRFRISMEDNELNTDNYFRAKVLVPHNPSNLSGDTEGHEDYDYEFGSKTREESYRDLIWNGVYTVKSYVPRFQKSRTVKTEKFSGIKNCNIYGQNNPMPYNNIRIKLPLMFTLLCALIKTYIRIVFVVNNVINRLVSAIDFIIDKVTWRESKVEERMEFLKTVRFVTIADGLCPDLENWFFAPLTETPFIGHGVDLMGQTLEYLVNGEDLYPPMIWNKEMKPDVVPIDQQNDENEGENICLTRYTDYLLPCIEMALAEEYRVMKFDFYNDWINGVIYMPRWMRYIRKKRRYLFGLIRIDSKIKACMDDTKMFKQSRLYVQQCALKYKKEATNGTYTIIANPNGCTNGNKQKCHNKQGMLRMPIFGGKNRRNRYGNGGIVHETETSKQQFVYYLKPCEWRSSDGKKTILFANDLVLLGSLNSCSLYGIPQAFKYLNGSSYIMPTNLALTNMDDDGAVYANIDGTVCTGRQVNSVPNVINNSFSGEQRYHNSEDSTFRYGELPEDTYNNIFDDTIPITEAAGISWNYTGPGQGNKSYNVTKSLYMPGGHFLGMSCVKSETNIKSCVNLQRICEVGANMSQRREEIRGVVDGKPQYRYFVPTGLISNDEINGGDFRTMFATMNHHRLLCDKRFDDKTGYPIYDFVYSRNVGFNGSLLNKINGDTSTPNPWNMKLDIIDEHDRLNPNIAQDEEYDYDEPNETYTRTLENPIVDYYKFRFGLDSLSDVEQRKKFIYSSGQVYGLPQYENSFYFYFGLRGGATAIDEFNRQFFSVCETESILKRKLTLKLSQTNVDTCNFTADIDISGENAGNDLRIQYKRPNSETTEAIDTEDIVNNYSTYYVEGGLVGLPFGEYIFTVSDDSEMEVTEKIVLGDGIVSCDISTFDFEFKTSNLSPQTVIETGKNKNCGYINIANLYIGGEPCENKIVTIVEVSDSGIPISAFTNNTNVTAQTDLFDKEYGVDYSIIGSVTNIEQNGKFYVWKSDTLYDVYIWSSSKSDCYRNGYVYRGVYSVYGVDNIDLYLGFKQLPYSTVLTGKTYEWALNPVQGINNTNMWDDIINGELLPYNWMFRYSLFRRNENDSEAFTNNVFGYNWANNREIGTALFGVPETSDGILDKVYYMGDTFNGSLSNESVMPTWGPSEITKGRRPFGEMAIYNNSIVSNKIGEFTYTSQIGQPRSSITLNGVVGTNVIPENHGCIGKFDDGNIVYLVREGGSQTFTFEGDITESDTISLYPLFYYPVMYRPFYLETTVIEWPIPTAYYDGTNVVVQYDKCNYIAQLIAHNGLTYNKTFGEVSVNSQRITTPTVSEHDCYDSGNTEGRTESFIVTGSPGFSYTCLVREGAPELLGFDVDIITKEQSIESRDYLESILYKKNTESTVTFIGEDRDDLTYYFVPAHRLSDIPPVPLVAYDYAVDDSEQQGFVTPAKFTGFDDKHSIIPPMNEDGTSTRIVYTYQQTIGVVMEYWYRNGSGMIVSSQVMVANIQGFDANTTIEEVRSRLDEINTYLINDEGLSLYPIYKYDPNADDPYDYCDDAISNAIRITFNTEMNVSVDPSVDYVIGVRTLSYGEKSNIKLLRIYTDLIETE